MVMVPRAPLERIMRQAGAESETEGAVEQLRESVEELGEELADAAVEEADAADRTTVTLADIEEAAR